MDVTTELEALNFVLEARGDFPVNSLESGLPDADKALRFLGETSRQVQGRGWWFNEEDPYTFTPDVSGNIQVPANVSTIDASGKDLGRDIIQRGSLLYDKDEQTDEFTGPVECHVIWLFDWDDLPQVFREYVKHEAALSFVKKTRGSTSRVRLLEPDRQLAWTNLKLEDSRNSDGNIFVNHYSFNTLFRR